LTDKFVGLTVETQKSAAGLRRNEACWTCQPAACDSV